MIADFLENMMRSVSYLLDGIFTWLFASFYNLFYSISNISVFGNETMAKFTTRLWAIIGVVMLFKITVSLISMFANPDSFYDSKKGMGNIVKRIIISLVLIGTTSFIFQAAFRIQHIILKENIIGNIILGTSTSPEETADYVSNAGNNVSFDIQMAFFTPNPKAQGYEQTLGEYQNWPKDFSVISDNLTAKDGDHYKFTYRYFLSTIVLALAAWIMFMFCFDVAIRSVKLAFLQLIAPVPIIAYVDPNKGEKAFKNWVRECVSTYLDVFMRLIVLDFAILVIAEFSHAGLFFEYDSNGMIVPGVGSGNVIQDMFAKSFIIIGILMFAQKLPQLISDISGIKFNTKFTMNPLKRVGESGLAAAGVAGVGGAVLGTAVNIGSGIKNKRGVLGTLRSGIGGGFSGGLRAGMDASGGKGNVASSITKGVTDSSKSRNLRRGDIEKGIPRYGAAERMTDWYATVSGTPYKTGTTQALDDEIKKLQNIAKNYEDTEHALKESLYRKIDSSGSYSQVFREAITSNFDDKGNFEPKNISNVISRIESNGKKLSDTEVATITNTYNELVSMTSQISEVDGKSKETNKQITKLKEQKSGGKKEK